MFNKTKQIESLYQENLQLKDKIDQYKLQAQNNKDILCKLSEYENIKESLKNLYKEDIASISEINYVYDFSDQYKRQIDAIREQQRNVDNAIYIHQSEYVNKDICKDIAKSMQCCFDIKCDDIMSKIKYNTKHNLATKINGLAQRIERNFNADKDTNITFNPRYIDLKISEVYLVFEYRCKKQDEKEQHIREVEILKDQAKADKEIEKNLHKDSHDLIELKYKYNKLKEQNKDASDTQHEIDILQESIKKNNDRLTNKKSGYVYVVGNRDMKNGLVKIGVTKRDISDRMKELGSTASHSFTMEVYGYVFVGDCYDIESQLHKYFKDVRLNVNNSHKEWFIATLPEVKDAFKNVCDIDIELNENPCEDYLSSNEKFLAFYQ